MTALRRAAVPLLVLLTTVGCLVPTLDELSETKRYACDEAHPCAGGWLCVGGKCFKDGTQPECVAGQTQPCGSDAGECRPGERRCEDGKFGACVGGVAAATETCDGKDNDCDGQTDEGLQLPACALSQGVCATARQRCVQGRLEACTASSYGVEYQADETRCDGKDNDCDGQVDEALQLDCPLQAGVCQGAKGACLRDGGVACGTAEYRQRNAAYAPTETQCDGLDNDCDGLTDAWGLTVSEAGGPAGRPAAVSTGGATLTLFEQGDRVRARLVSSDRSLSPAVPPGASVDSAVRARLPALGADGALVFAAWAEETTSGVRRVMIAPVSPSTGRSTLAAEAATPVQDAVSVDPQELQIAVDGTSQRVLVAWIEGGVLSLRGRPVDVLNSGGTCVGPGNALCSFAVPSLATGARRVRLASLGGAFLVAWESGGSAQACLVDHIGTLSCGATVAGASPTPTRGDAGPAVVTLAALDGGAPALVTYRCSAAPDAGPLDCAQPEPIAGFGAVFTGAVDLAFPAFERAPRFVAVDDGAALTPWVADAGSRASFPGRRASASTLGAQLGLVAHELDGGQVSARVFCLP